jgi:hypothetical protein
MSYTNGAMAPHPVHISVAEQLSDRNRLTTGFRLILAVPHIMIVGGLGSVGFALGDLRSVGALAAAAGTMSVIAWFAIVLTGIEPRGLWDFVSST